MNAPKFTYLNEPYIIFAGSAISIWLPSEAPSASQMRNLLLEGLLDICPDHLKFNLDLTPLLKWNGPRLEWIYEELWGIFGDSVLTVMECYNFGEPNLLHDFLAKQFKSGMIKRIYTTNQDCFIEKSLKRLDYIENKNYSVILPDQKSEDSIFSNKLLIKLHGSVSQTSSIRTTFRHIGLGLSKKLYDLFKHDLKNNTFVFIGYSGLDIDIQPILMESNPLHIIWTEDPNVDLKFHFARTLENNAKNLEFDLFDISRPVGNIYPNLFLPSDNIKKVKRIIQNIYRNVLDISQAEAAHILSKIFRLKSLNEQRDICMSASFKLPGPIRQKWNLYYLKAESYLYSGRIIVNNIKAIYYYFKGSRIGFKEGAMNGYIVCKIGIGLSIDMLFYGAFHPIYIVSLLFIYIPLYKKLPFASLSNEENRFLKYETLFYIARALLRLGKINLSERIFNILIKRPSGHRHILGHALRFMAKINTTKGRFSDAEQLYSRSKAEYEYRQMEPEIADVERMKAYHFFIKKDYSNAKESINKSIEIYQRRKNERGLKKAMKIFKKISRYT